MEAELLLLREEVQVVGEVQTEGVQEEVEVQGEPEDLQWPKVGQEE